MSLRLVQEKENRKNEQHSLLQFYKDDECPKCEGYGEIYDSIDFEQPHKECDRCFGTGQFYGD